MIAGIKGTLASSIDLIYETLLVSSLDEKSSGYGLLAEAVPDICNGKLFKQNPFVADCREIIGGGPILGAILSSIISTSCATNTSAIQPLHLKVSRRT
jgi:hypothetical protein